MTSTDIMIEQEVDLFWQEKGEAERREMTEDD